MRVVSVRFRMIKVDYFSAVDGTVSVEIFFNDGADKQVLKKMNIKSPHEMTEELVTDMKVMEKNINLQFDGEKIAGEVKVVMEGEAEVRKKLMHFFEEITARTQRIKNMKTSDGYLELIRDIKKMAAAL